METGLCSDGIDDCGGGSEFARQASAPGTGMSSFLGPLFLSASRRSKESFRSGSLGLLAWVERGPPFGSVSGAILADES